jgi:anaerobic magnesium-protoporphyrin IX monomethyl ester cyclase
MKILFITKPSKVAPLGIMYISSALKKAGHEVKNTHELYESSVIIGDWQPDYVCYSVLTGDQDFWKRFDTELHEVMEFKSIFGGNHVTFFPQDFEGELIIRGEGEQALLDLIEGRGQDKIHFIDDIDSLSFPDRELIEEGKIKHFIASRGCPYKCTYCYNEKWAQLHGKKRVRTRSVDNVVQEINEVKPEFAYFQDDTFGLNIKWLEEFADKYPKIPFHCHVRAEIVNQRYVDALKKAGCYSVHIALETDNEKLLRVLGRKRESIITACQLLKESGIKTMLQNIIGIPEGEIKYDLETLYTNTRIAPDYSWVSIYQPYPGTVLGDECISKGWAKPSDIKASFFEESCLTCFDDKYKGQLKVLQKTWASLVDGNYDPILDTLYNNMRKEGDLRLYGFNP